MEDNPAEDFIALWQSELTAMAADRELRESWAGMMALWASMATATLQMMRNGPHDAAGGARPAEPPGPAPAAPASQPRLVEVDQLNRRVAELEQRVAELLRNGGGTTV